MPQSFEGCAGELPRNKGGQGRIRKESWFPNGGGKTPLLEDLDKGQKEASGTETIKKEELLLRELLVQDKKGLERKGQKRAEKRKSPKKRKSGPARNTKGKQKES